MTEMMKVKVLYGPSVPCEYQVFSSSTSPGGEGGWKVSGKERDWKAFCCIGSTWLGTGGQRSRRPQSWASSGMNCVTSDRSLTLSGSPFSCTQ